MERALEGAERTGFLTLQARCLSYLTVLHRLQGGLAETRLLARRTLEVARKLRMADYLGIGEANLGWCAWREGKRDEAAHHTAEALIHWRQVAASYPAFPFQWLGRLHAIALALDEGATEGALEHAGNILKDVQHRLSDGVMGPLAEAVAAASSEGGNAAARAALEVGLANARTLRYL
jgi:hypothetical protein